MLQAPLINCGRRLQRILASHCPELELAALAETLGLQIETIMAEDGGITARDYQRVLQALVQRSGQPTLPVLIGLDAQAADFGLFGMSLMSCSSVEEMAAVGERYYPLNGYGFTITNQFEGNDWVLRFNSPSFGSEGTPQYLMEEFIALSTRVLADILPGANAENVLAVYFTFPAPVHHREYQRLLGCEVLFNQDCNEIRLHRQSLEQQLDASNPDIARFLWKQCQQQLEQSCDHKGGDLTEEVRQLLRQWLPERLPTQQQMAEQLYVSPRTLNRKLQQQGQTYSRLLTEERMGLARQYLAQGKHSVQTIAWRLGYAQPSSFFRAYRKYFGVSPKAGSSQSSEKR